MYVKGANEIEIFTKIYKINTRTENSQYYKTWKCVKKLCFINKVIYTTADFIKKVLGVYTRSMETFYP